jgi:tRNA (mo5U34)-methyltransferase
MGTIRVSGRTLRERIAEHHWYHTIELAPGVVTPGWMDTRKLVAELPFPASLRGQRCLDVGTFDGFWALDMERRGAAEVVAIDILDPRHWDWPAGSAQQTIEEIGRRKAGGAGFELAVEVLESAVRRLELSVHDLNPAQHGKFDFVYVGSLLLHLRDPVGALERIRGVCRGHLLAVDGIDLPLTVLAPRRPLARLDGLGRPWWWRPNLAGLARMVQSAGFELVAAPRRIRVPPGPGQPRPPARPATVATRDGRTALAAAVWGDPHGVVLAQPASGARLRSSGGSSSGGPK